MAQTPEPWRVRFRVPLTVIPPVIDIAVAVPLWGARANLVFFEAATHVLAIGAVGMALTGHFFRLAIHRDAGAGGSYAIFNVLFVLVATGVGLGFAFGALAAGHAREPDLALTAGALSSGISAFAIQAMFGTPGTHREDPELDAD
ncbi:MAG: hypothetical protein QOK31_1311 [Solirubrobacteraceae bacterium]|jgi:hypothetical protein|nr:hypothetical protein [Solirubrobacteraceae bacterium]